MRTTTPVQSTNIRAERLLHYAVMMALVPLLGMRLAVSKYSVDGLAETADAGTGSATREAGLTLQTNDLSPLRERRVHASEPIRRIFAPYVLQQSSAPISCRNILVNGSFESDLDHWHIISQAGAIDTQGAPYPNIVPREGTHMLSLAPQPSKSILVRSDAIFVPAESRLVTATLSYWWVAEDKSDESGFAALVTGLQGTKSGDLISKWFVVKNTTDIAQRWQFQQISLTDSLEEFGQIGGQVALAVVSDEDQHVVWHVDSIDLSVCTRAIPPAHTFLFSRPGS